MAAPQTPEQLFLQELLSTSLPTAGSSCVLTSNPADQQLILQQLFLTRELTASDPSLLADPTYAVGNLPGAACPPELYQPALHQARQEPFGAGKSQSMHHLQVRILQQTVASCVLAHGLVLLRL